MLKSDKIALLLAGLFLIWTGLITYVYEQEHASKRDLVVKLALAEARGNYRKDLVYRRWVALQGGIYVQPSQTTPPNPYLSHLPERDLKTTNGQDLTLINPAYMTRQVHELAQSQYGVRGHITSLKPLRPENAPDPWERQSLEAFQTGVKETYIQTTMDGEPYLRLMLPMVTESMCLRCHGAQSYRLGDIRGGISVSVPLAAYFKAQSDTLGQERANKILLWCLGSILLILCYYIVHKYLRREALVRQEIERSEEKYRVVFDGSTVGLALADYETGVLLECNRKLLTLVERSQEEVRNKPQSFLHIEDFRGKSFTDEFLIHRDDSPRSLLETVLLTKSGTTVPVEIKAKPVWINNQKMMLGIFRDLSEQKAVERQIVKNEKMFRAVLNGQYDAVFLFLVSAGRIYPFEMVNDIAAKRYGYSREELLTLTLEDLTAGEETVQQLVTDLIDSATPQHKANVVMSHRSKAGEIFPVEVSISILDLDGQEYILAVARDISDRVNFHKESQDLLAKLRHLSSQIPGMVYQFERSISGHYSMTFTSDAIYSLFELAPEDVKMSAEPIFRKVHPEDIPATLRSIQLSEKQLSLWRHEFRVIKNNGSVCWLEGNSIPKKQSDGRIIWYGHVSDISERKEEERQQRKLLQQLRQREKINAVGMLASGISHNFNNHLAIILGNIDLAKRANVSVDDRISLLKNAHIAATRASDMVHQIMRFSRQDEQDDASINLVNLLLETGKLLTAILPSAIQKDFAVPEDVSDFTMKANASRIQDVLLNLSTNAVHAMGERGTLTVSLEKIASTDERLPVECPANSGGYACFSVADTGCGIAADTLNKIFDPFYTTKDVGQGTGLGLSTAKESVEYYGGAISVISEPGNGTTFKVYLPLSGSSVENTKTKDKVISAGNERILLVDDEPMINELNADILKSLGYDVDYENDSMAALDIFRKNPNLYDLVVTDQVMPSLTGLELAKEIQAIRPVIPIVLVTGYSLDVTAETMRKYGVFELCRKPFEVADIADVVRRALDSEPHKRK